MNFRNTIRVVLLSLLAGVVIGVLVTSSFMGRRKPPVYDHRVDSVVALIAEERIRYQLDMDSLQRIIQAERITQAHHDSIINSISTNPKYSAHAYRDSSTLAKLDFIIGADRR